MPEWERSSTFDCEVWRPILSWTEQQVVDIHRRHGLPPHPLYLLGAERVGCWPCIYVRKAEMCLIVEKEYEPFVPADQDQGCMRWGLCETSTPEGEDA